jgi:hypothetical protein
MKRVIRHLLAFHCYDKILKINNLKKERFVFTHSFTGISPLLLGHIALDLWLFCAHVAVQYIIVGACGKGGCSWWPGNRQKGPGPQYPLLGHPPVT